MTTTADQNRAGAGSVEGQSPSADSAHRAVVFAIEGDDASIDVLLGVAAKARLRFEVFDGCAALIDALSHTVPDLIFLEVDTQGVAAVETLHALSKQGYPGALQLVADPGVPMLDAIRQLAQLHSLKALNPIIKPLNTAVVTQILQDLKPAVSQAKAVSFGVEEAIQKGWLQFWYQPKISFKNRTLIGMETFVRVFHPHKGLLPPATVLKNADEKGLAALAQCALLASDTACTRLSELGLRPSIAINVSLKSLSKLPVARIFRDHVARTQREPNWVFDVSEEDIASHEPVLKDLSKVFRSAGIKLAVDNFNGTVVPATALKELPITELKLSPSFVSSCDSKPRHADVCKALIELAHRMQCTAVAVGVETAGQSQILQDLGCDVGQGFLFGHPLPLEQIVSMIRQRSVQAKQQVARAS